jgi:ABC-2 type transport system ATP-binding protein
VTSTEASAARLLSVRDLEVAAGARSILRGISFWVRAGEVLVVLGPNGSGKTTLLEAVAGLRPGASARVRVGEKELRSFRDRCSQLAYMPDDEQLPDEVSLGTALGLHAVDDLVEAFALGPLLEARATEVSRGETKRARLCATLALGRPVVLLDEPFAAFDPRQLRALLPRFREAVRAAATIVTVHQMRTAELVADRLLLLAGGRTLAIGTLDDLRVRAEAPDAPLDDVFLRLLDREELDASA